MRALLLLGLLALAPSAAWAQDVPAIAPPAAPPAPAPVAASPNPVPAGTPAIAPAAAPSAAGAPTAEGAPAAAPPRRPRRTVRRAPSQARQPNDGAYMGGGMPSGSNGFEARVTAPPRPELAPRPNLDMEGPRAAAPSNNPVLEPTLINPRLPGRSQVQDSGVTQRENRLLQSPAPGARLSVPMSW